MKIGGRAGAASTATSTNCDDEAPPATPVGPQSSNSLFSATIRESQSSSRSRDG